MKSKQTKQFRFVILLVLSLLTISASAQFRKPLPSRNRGTASDAKLNIGIVGGGNLTKWLHFQNPNVPSLFPADYTQNYIQSIGYEGGIALEYLISKNFSVGLNAVYAEHNFLMEHLDDRFPYSWDSDNNTILYAQKQNFFTTRYHSVEAYIPLTFFFNLPGSKSTKPYTFVAPRFSYVLPGGTMTTGKTTTYGASSSSQPTTQTTQAIIQKDTYTLINVGATVGLGSQFRFNTSNYYFMLKFDLSANMYALNTYNRIDMTMNQLNYRRYATDAHATLTFLLPVKKRLKDSCVKWGKFD